MIFARVWSALYFIDKMTLIIWTEFFETSMIIFLYQNIFYWNEWFQDEPVDDNADWSFQVTTHVLICYFQVVPVSYARRQTHFKYRS
jgi:hypothetical protein